MAAKTYAQLAVQADVQSGDLLASYRGTGPLKQLTADIYAAWAIGTVTGASGHKIGYLDVANTFSASQTFSLATATTAADYIVLKPTDYAAGKPGLFFSKTTTATIWQMTVTDGTTLGELDFSVSILKVSGTLTVTAGATITGTSKGNVVAIAALAIDVQAGEYQTKSIGTNSVFTFTNPAASLGQGFLLDLTISSSAVPTWPASVKWSGGLAPSLGNGLNSLGFITFDGGTSWQGYVGGQAFA